MVSTKSPFGKLYYNYTDPRWRCLTEAQLVYNLELQLKDALAKIIEFKKLPQTYRELL